MFSIRVMERFSHEVGTVPFISIVRQLMSLDAADPVAFSRGFAILMGAATSKTSFWKPATFPVRLFPLTVSVLPVPLAAVPPVTVPVTVDPVRLTLLLLDAAP